MFFQALKPTYVHSNVVQAKQGDEIVDDPLKVIDICMTYFTELFGSMLVINDDVINARREFYNLVGSVMDEAIRVELDSDFLEDEVEKVLMHLLNGKIHVGMVSLMK